MRRLQRSGYLRALGTNTTYVAEALVSDENEKETYATVQDYDGMMYTVSKESVYAFLAEDEGEPASELLEEYTSLKEAKTSAYADVFKALRSVLKSLG